MRRFKSTHLRIRAFVWDQVKRFSRYAPLLPPLLSLPRADRVLERERAGCDLIGATCREGLKVKEALVSVVSLSFLCDNTMSREETLDDVWRTVAESMGTEIFDKINVPGTFIGVVVEFLLFEKGRRIFQVKAAAVGLCKYGVFDEDDLKAIADTKREFGDALSAKGVPGVICDALFDKYVAPAQIIKLPTIEEVCNKYIKTHVKLKELPELENFIPPQNSPFKTFARENVKVPKLPSKTGGYDERPYMLFHGLSALKKEETEESKMYRYISKNSPHGPTSIYGTSGAGKTRGAFEYLSCNWGIYLTFHGSTVNPGSKDMDHVLNYLAKLKPEGLEEILEDDDENHRQIKDIANQDVVRQVLSCVLYVRWRVLRSLRESLGDKFKPYHWLLIQLHPQQFFDKHDIFQEMTEEITSSCAATTQGNLALLILLENEGDGVNTVFVDETQILCEELKEGYFISTNSTETSRSAYSAFLVAFTGISHDFSTKIGYPIMMGTGLSYSSIEKEKGSAMAKELPTNYVDMFSSLEVLNPEQVITYIEKVANLESVDKKVSGHMGRWLQDRPCWTATFLSMWMSGKLDAKNNTPSCNSEMNQESKDLLALIEHFVELMARRRDAEGTQDSWNLRSLMPRTAIQELTSRRELADLKIFFERAVLNFALHGSALVHGEFYTDKSAQLPTPELVKIGVARCEKATNRGFVQIKIDEPLIVEAALPLDTLVEYSANKLVEADEKSELGRVSI